MKPLDWTRIDHVLLDMDGTLLDLHFDNYFWQHWVPLHYAQQQALDLDDAKQRLMEKYSQVRGHIHWYCLDYWQAQLDLDIRQLKQRIKDKIAYRPGAEDFLRRIQALGKECLLVTNAHRASLDLKVQQTQLDSYFDALISSHDYGMAKEHPAFWQHLEAATGINPERSLFIDDSAAVLAAADAFGIAQVWGIARPDSQQATTPSHAYPLVTEFVGLF